MFGHFREFEDEYIETLYEFHENEPGQYVRNGDLAKKLGIKPASATEMVQRLANKGFLEYVPYKGAKMTPSGIEYGKKMKRRHRLAEVLLDIIPFDGNAHETACRLEHAIDDDLDVALEIMLGSPRLDPSGRDIPELSDELKTKASAIQNKYCSLNEMKEGDIGEIAILFCSEATKIFLDKNNMNLGSLIEVVSSGYKLESGVEVGINPEISKGILVLRH